MHYNSSRTGRTITSAIALTLTLFSLLSICLAVRMPTAGRGLSQANSESGVPRDELTSNPSPAESLLASYSPGASGAASSARTRRHVKRNAKKQSSFSVSAVPGIAQITISWPAVGGSGTVYTVRWHCLSGGGNILTTTGGLTATQTTSLSNGLIYYYNVSADLGTTHLGSGVSSNVMLWLPGPASINCYVNGSGHTILNWSPVTGATSYLLTGYGPYTTSATTYDVGIIPAYTNYGLTISSANSCGYGGNIHINTIGSSSVPNALPTYVNAQPYCPLCALLHGAGEGDPVNLATGSEVYAPAADLSVYNPNGVGFTFARTFTSTLSAHSVSSPGMGAGWTHPYDFSVRTIPGGSTSWPNLELVYPTAATETWAPILSGGSPTGAFAHVTGAPYIVTGSPGSGGAWNSLTMTWKDGTTWTFTALATEAYALTLIQNQVGQGISISYDSGRRLTGIYDYTSTTQLVSFTYDVYGMLASVNDLYGRSVFYTNGSSASSQPELLNVSQITATTVGAGGATSKASITYTIAGGAQLNSITVPSPTGSGTATASFNYTGTGQIASIVDGNNNNFGFTYNYLNTIVKMKSSAGVVALTYTEYFDSSGRMTSIKDANSHSKIWAYGDTSNPFEATSFTDENSDVTTLTYDAFGSATAVTSPIGVTTTSTYAYTAFPMGRLVQIQTGTLSPTTFTYYEPSGLISSIAAPEPGGSGTVTSSYVYDGLGNMTSATVPGSGAYTIRTITLNYTTDGTYSQGEALGQPLTITDNGGNISHYRYDFLGHVVSEVDPLGCETDFGYNIAEQQIQETYPPTGQTGPGRSYSTTTYLFPGGLSTSDSVYDESGGLARTVSIAYGPEGEVLSTSGFTDAAQFTYDADYRVVTAKDGNSGVTTFGYDLVGNLSTETIPGGNIYSYPTYDAAHHLLQKIDPNGIITNYTYASPGSLLSTINAPLDSSVNASLGYDSYGRLSSMSDSSGTRTSSYCDSYLASEVTTYTGLPAQTVSFGFNPDGSRLSMSTPSGTFVYGYDSVGHLSSLTNPFGETSAWSYSARGDLIAQILGNGSGSTYRYNALGQLTQLQNLNPLGSVLSSYGTVAYNATGDLTSVAAAINGSLPTSGTLSFAYDPLDRLTHESSTLGSGYSLAHGYDPNSNLTTLRGSTLTYNSKGQLSTTGMTFDPNGNPTTYNGTGITFDSDDRLTAFGTAMTAGYRSDHLRAWKSAGTTTTYFLYDGATLLCELDSSGNVLRTYTNGANGLLSSNTSAGSIFYTFDYRGATVHRLDSYGNIVTAHGSDAYGADLALEADPYSGFGAQFGYYHDSETGLFYLQNRYYDPAFGRFLNRDPTGLDGGTNRYGFVAGNPVTRVDPWGLDGITIWGYNFTPDVVLDGLDTYANAARKMVGAPYSTGAESKPGFEFAYYSSAVGFEAATWAASEIIAPIMAAKLAPVAARARALKAALAASKFNPRRAKACAFSGEGVYRLVTKTGKVYIGQTSDILRRFGEHGVNKLIVKNGGLDYIEFMEVKGGKLAREVAEQRLINSHGLENLLNQRNAIGAARKHLMSRFPG